MNATQARSLPIVDLLASFGFRPARQTATAAWYRSPLRSAERTPSFKVCLRSNLWYDHGSGKGGNALDLACRLYGTSDVTQVLGQLRGSAATLRPLASDSSSAASDRTRHRLQILETGRLKDPQLIDYLKRRGISVALGLQWLCEARYRVGPYQWSALGFWNDLGGLELRSRAFKGCSAPKSPTWIRKNSPRLVVFEGFFDFLSWLTLREIDQPDHDVVVLNSLAYAPRIGRQVGQYRRVDAYLDNDPAGRAALVHFPNACDYGSTLGTAKDLNQWMCRYLRRA